MRLADLPMVDVHVFTERVSELAVGALDCVIRAAVGESAEPDTMGDWGDSAEVRHAMRQLTGTEHWGREDSSGSDRVPDE